MTVTIWSERPKSAPRPRKPRTATVACETKRKGQSKTTPAIPLAVGQEVWMRNSHEHLPIGLVGHVAEAAGPKDVWVSVRFENGRGICVVPRAKLATS